MNMELSPECRMLMDSLSRYLMQRYDFQTREKIARSGVGFSLDHWQKFSELGVLSALFDESDGGLSGDANDIQGVFECLGRHLVIEPFQDSLVVGRMIAKFGQEGHKPLLEQLISGSRVSALAHFEPGGHYEMSLVNTQAVQRHDGWTLTGSKTLVHQAEMADYFLVSARTRGACNREDGIALFLVPRSNPDLAVNGYRMIDGGRAAELSLDEVCISNDAMLCDASEGYAALEYGIGFGLLALCAEAVGAMDVARDETLEYLRTRKQFNTPLGKFQALQHRMVDLAVEIEQARSAVVNAASAFFGPRLQRERALSAAKYTVGKVGIEVAQECIQLMGGIGMTWELPLSHYAKRLVMIDHQYGDEDHHLERYIQLGRSQDDE